jgi:hypothetical protein
MWLSWNHLPCWRYIIVVIFLSHLQQICPCNSVVWQICCYLGAWVSGSILCCVPLLQICLVVTRVDARHVSYILSQSISLPIIQTHIHTHMICFSVLWALVSSHPSHVWTLRSQSVDWHLVWWSDNLATQIILFLLRLHVISVTLWHWWWRQSRLWNTGC